MKNTKEGKQVFWSMNVGWVQASCDIFKTFILIHILFSYFFDYFVDYLLFCHLTPHWWCAVRFCFIMLSLCCVDVCHAALLHPDPGCVNVYPHEFSQSVGFFNYYNKMHRFLILQQKIIFWLSHKQIWSFLLVTLSHCSTKQLFWINFWQITAVMKKIT